MTSRDDSHWTDWARSVVLAPADEVDEPADEVRIAMSRGAGLLLKGLLLDAIEVLDDCDEEADRVAIARRAVEILDEALR